MTNELVINARPHETRVALVENGIVVELYIKRGSEQELVGNIYLGRVLRVLPGMQAAFVDIGIDKPAFLYVTDVYNDLRHWEQIMLQEGDDDNSLEVATPLRTRSLKGCDINIEGLLQEGQDILVQVSKEPLGTKGSRLTSHITLPGRHLVFMPTVDHIGISRRIEDEKERLKEKEKKFHIYSSSGRSRLLNWTTSLSLSLAKGAGDQRVAYQAPSSGRDQSS